MIAEQIGIRNGIFFALHRRSFQNQWVIPKAHRYHAIGTGGQDWEDHRETHVFLQGVLDASTDVLLEYPFILSEVAGGHIGVRAGVDQSDIDDGMIILLPPDSMKAADCGERTDKGAQGIDIGVIITDMVGRAFRRGQTGNAIGWSGMSAIRDFRGDTDLFGHVLKITEEAVVDEIAGFANFIDGESNNGVPAVIFRGCETWKGHDDLYYRAG